MDITDLKRKRIKFDPEQEFEKAFQSALRFKRLADSALWPIFGIIFCGIGLAALVLHTAHLSRQSISVPYEMYDQLSPAQIEELKYYSYPEAENFFYAVGLSGAPGTRYILGQIALRDDIALSHEEWKDAIDDMPLSESAFEKISYMNGHFYHDAEVKAYGAPQSSVAKRQAADMRDSDIRVMKFWCFYFIFPELFFISLWGMWHSFSRRERERAALIYVGAPDDVTARIEEAYKFQKNLDVSLRANHWLVFLFRPSKI